MKKLIGLLLFSFVLLTIGTTSCKTGEGCQQEEAYHKNKDKPLSKKRGKSRLFKK